MRNGEVSYWWQARGVPARRPSLPGSTEADGGIVGAGYTGLWTPYYLSRADPALRIVVLEASFAGYGASGRNGGWGTAELPGAGARYHPGPRGAGGGSGPAPRPPLGRPGGQAAPPARAGTGVGRRRRDRSVPGKDGTG